MSTFDAGEFVRDIGLDLVRAFANARKVTTPGSKGDAMETSVRDRFEQLLPRGIGVGHGFVIDVSWRTSRQIDVVLFEKQICPVFSIQGVNHYPCEGVLAVGEIKSSVGKKELKDAFSKISSVKSLRRMFEKSGPLAIGRRYGDHNSPTAEAFELQRSNMGDVFGFILSEKPSIKPTNLSGEAGPFLTGHYRDNVMEMRNDVLCPDLTVFLDGNFIYPSTLSPSTHAYIPARAKPVLPHVVSSGIADSPFGYLLQKIWNHHRDGLTAHIPMARYLRYTEGTHKQTYSWAPLVHELLNDEVTPTDHLDFGTKPMERKPSQ